MNYVSPKWEGFLEGTSMQNSFAVQIVDQQNNPVTDTEISFTVSPTENAYVVPEKVTTNETGIAYSALVMKQMGTYTVTARAVEFPDIAPLTFTAECRQLPVTGFDTNNPTQIIQAGLPLITLVKSGQAQIAVSGTNLALPLVAEARNMFGQAPLLESAVESLLAAYYRNYLGDSEIKFVSVVFRANSYMEFKRIEGAGEFEGAPGVSSIRVPLSGGNSGDAQTQFIFGNNPINPVVIQCGAGASPPYYFNLVLNDENPNSGPSINDVPRPNLYYYSAYVSFFAISPPEMRFVRQSGSNYNELSQLSTYGVFDRNWQPLQQTPPEALYNVEYLLPSNYSGTPSLTLRAYDECRNPITETGRGVAQISQNISNFTIAEENERFRRYRSGPIQNTQELFQPNMDRIVITGGLPNKTLLQANVGGYTYAEDTILGVREDPPNNDAFFVSNQRIKRTNLCEIDGSPEWSPQPGLVFYIYDKDNQTTAESKTLEVQSPVGTVSINLKRKEPGLFISDKPIVVADENLDLSFWTEQDEYYLIRTRSNTNNNCELEIINSGNKVKTSKPALAFMSIDKGETENYYNSEISLDAATKGLYYKLNYELSRPSKITRMETSKLFSPGTNVQYNLSKYSVLYARCHGKAYARGGYPKINEFAGFSLGCIKEGEFVYDSAKDTVDPDAPWGDFLKILFAEELVTYRRNSIFNPDYKFVFLDGCLTAENNLFDPNEETQIDYLMSDGAKYMMEALNTHAYMGWQKRPNSAGMSEFTWAFFRELVNPEVNNGKNIPIQTALNNALDPTKYPKVAKYPYVKQMIKLIVGSDARAGSNANAQEYYIDIRN